MVQNVSNWRQDGALPANESQARPLTKLEPEQQREAWSRAGELGEPWGLKQSRAYQMMDAAAVVGNLASTIVELPANEAQARPLTKLEPEQQREAWSRAGELGEPWEKWWRAVRTIYRQGYPSNLPTPPPEGNGTWEKASARERVVLLYARARRQ